MSNNAVTHHKCVGHAEKLLIPPRNLHIHVVLVKQAQRFFVLHAVFRQNCGCTHLIVGRDHAGVGDYYGGFDAQTIFDEEVPAGSLDIEIYRADHTAYSKKLGKVVMMRDAPDHEKEDFVLLSGTKVREMLGQGIAPPPEFSRPEVAQILMDYYQSQ